MVEILELFLPQEKTTILLSEVKVIEIQLLCRYRIVGFYSVVVDPYNIFWYSYRYLCDAFMHLLLLGIGWWSLLSFGGSFRECSVTPWVWESFLENHQDPEELCSLPISQDLCV